MEWAIDEFIVQRFCYTGSIILQIIKNHLLNLDHRRLILQIQPTNQRQNYFGYLGKSLKFEFDFLQLFDISICVEVMWQAVESSSIDDEEEEGFYEVESILSKRFRKENGQSICEYLIKWKGYPRLQDQTWQPTDNLKNVGQLISEYEGKQRRQKKIQTSLSKDDSISKRPLQDKDKKKHQVFDRLTKKVKKDSIFIQPQRHKLPENNKQANLFQAKNLSAILQQNHQTQINSVKSFSKKDDKIREITQFLPDLPSKNMLHKKDPLIQQMKNSQSKYGKIVNHLYTNQQLFYEVEVFNQNKKLDRVQVCRAIELRKYCAQQISEYLENYLIFLIKFNKAQK